MTIQHIQQTSVGERGAELAVDGEVEELDLVASMLHNCMIREHNQADMFSEEASRTRARARDLEEKAMECRAREQRYRRLLKLDAAGDDLYGEIINDEGDAQTTLIPRQRRMYPLVHPDGSNTPHLACVNCGTALREATAGEVETVLAGGDVQPHCNNCTPSNGKDVHPYPPVPPQDAA